jgi:biotin carboxylase
LSGKKTVLFVGGGIEAVPALQLARRMGLCVVVSDKDPKAPGFAHADDGFVASTYDVEATVEAAKRFARERGPIDGVLSCAVDVPVTVARVAQELGLHGLGLETARLSADKLAMKERFARDGVPIPWFCAVSSARQLEDIVGERGFELVLKPVDSRGSRGVLRLGEKIDLRWAYEHSSSCSPTGRVMVEQYLAGPQVSTESIVIGGIAHTPGFSDRNYELLEKFSPYFIENGGELPSHLDEATQNKVRALVQKAAASMGIDNWVAKGDIVVHQGEPHVIEIAARLSGGYFSTHEIPLNTGVSTVESVIRLAVGESIDEEALIPQYSRPVVQRYLFAEPGRVVLAEGEAEARAIEGIEEVVVSVKPGDVIHAPTNSTVRAAMVMAVGQSRKQALERAVRAVETLKIRTE